MKPALLHFHFYRSFIMIFLLLIFHAAIFCQAKISGHVLDIDHQPVDGATIAIKGSANGTVSSSDGSFSIDAKPGDMLQVTAVGMIKQEVIIRGQAHLIIILSFAYNNMEEVMVVGYGTSKRKDITGAVSKLSSGEFNTGIITNPLQQLQGKVAGVVITQPGGDPNGDLIARVRGATSLEGQPPLVVIDGIAIDDFDKAIATINPNDIESYDLLKDASAAAIYGARGANGVMIVTTKKSRHGKTSIDYNGFIGVEKVSSTLKLLNTDEWRNATAGMGGSALDKDGNTDWQKEILQTAFSHSHLISIGGGFGAISFRGSLGYLKQEGILLGSSKEIFTSRIVADQKSLNNRFSAKYAINTSVTNRDFLTDQYSTSQARTGGTYTYMYPQWYLPVWPVYNPDGSYYIPPTLFNPVWVLQDIYNKQRENFFQTAVKAEYEIVKDLKIGALGALTRANDVLDRFWPTDPQGNGTPEASKSNFNKQIYSGDLHGSYHRTFNKHQIDFTGVYEYNKYINDGFSVRARGFLVMDLLNNNLGAATNVSTTDIDSYKNEVKLISFLGRIVYNFDDRYIVTANFRRDGSSKFGPNHRWGNFPSVAFAWHVRKENFLKKSDWLNDLKFRISYGLTGNQENIPPYTTQRLYGPSGPYLYNGQFLQSYAVIQEYNPDLKWEVRKSFNIGLDFSVLNNRLTGVIDVFNDHTDDMVFLYDIPQPPFLTNKVYANAASAVNKGVEITLAAKVINKRNFNWEIKANMATLENSITQLLGQFKGVILALNDPSYGYAHGGGFGKTAVTQLFVGYPAGVFWLPRHAGFDAAGRELFENYDADGKFTGTSASFTNQDKFYMDPTPDFTWGLTQQFQLQNFDLVIFLRGVQGQKIFANSLLNVGSVAFLPGRNIARQALTNGFTALPLASDYWLQNASFCRLENVTLGYTISNWKIINKLRIYFTASNLFVVTNYEGIDPEISTDSPQRYIDYGYYPRTRGYMIGLNVSF